MRLLLDTHALIWWLAVDRHVRTLLEKVGAGLYMTPRQTRFGEAPAKPEKS